jgi:hypothetical protein
VNNDDGPAIQEESPVKVGGENELSDRLSSESASDPNVRSERRSLRRLRGTFDIGSEPIHRGGRRLSADRHGDRAARVAGDVAALAVSQPVWHQ